MITIVRFDNLVSVSASWIEGGKAFLRIAGHGSREIGFSIR